MALQLDLDYADELAPHEFERFASLIDPTWMNAHCSRAWPQLRAACLMDTYTHLIRAASFGDYRTGELSFAAPLMQAVPDDSLTIFDRAYFSAAFLLDWQKARAAP